MEIPGPISSLRIPDDVSRHERGFYPAEGAYTLPKSVSAIQILPTEDAEKTRLGLITQLPEGSELEIGGPGFSDRTISVRCCGASYYVFLDDLETAKRHMAMATAS